MFPRSVTSQKFMEEVLWPHPLTLLFIPSHRGRGNLSHCRNSLPIDGRARVGVKRTYETYLWD